MSDTNLVPFNPQLAALSDVVRRWAESCTDMESAHAAHLVGDKCAAVMSFLSSAGKPPQACGSADVSRWLDGLRASGLREATIYARASRVSAFYSWAIEHAGAGVNPVAAVRPKAPKPYQSERVKSLTDEQMRRLVRHVASLPSTTNNRARRLTYLRDHAILRFLFASGMRRNEILQLTWGKTRLLPNGIEIETRVKGGEWRKVEIAQESVKDALLHYLHESGRFDKMAEDSPLWMGHDVQGNASPTGIDARVFLANLKRYGRAVGIPDLHTHMTRHTYARIISEDTGSIIEAQDALGHSNANTTRVYVRRLGVKRDKHSDKVMGRL